MAELADEVKLLLPSELIVTRQCISGSAYFFGEGEDLDILVEVPDLVGAMAVLIKDGWVHSAFQANKKDTAWYIEDDGWFSVRRFDFNLLVHKRGQPRYDLMLKARAVVKELADRGVLHKNDKALRVRIHQLINGEAPL